MQRWKGNDNQDIIKFPINVGYCDENCKGFNDSCANTKNNHIFCHLSCDTEIFEDCLTRTLLHKPEDAARFRLHQEELLAWQTEEKHSAFFLSADTALLKAILSCVNVNEILEILLQAIPMHERREMLSTELFMGRIDEDRIGVFSSIILIAVEFWATDTVRIMLDSLERSEAASQLIQYQYWDTTTPNQFAKRYPLT